MKVAAMGHNSRGCHSVDDWQPWVGGGSLQMEGVKLGGGENLLFYSGLFLSSLSQFSSVKLGLR
jgi:hypothetical protein